MGQKNGKENDNESSDNPGELPAFSDIPEKYKRKGRRQSVSAEADVDTEPYVPKKIPKSPEVVVRIMASITSSFLFSGLESEQVKEIVDAMEEKKVDEGDTAIREGDTGDYFYIVESGQYEVLKKIEGQDKKVFEYNNQGIFGELALMYNCPRAATVRALTPGTLWAVDRMTFRRIIITNTARTRALYESFLLKVPLFENLTSGERSLIADCLVSVTFHDGDIVLRQGEVGDKFFLIEKGEAVATQILPETGDNVVVGRMKAGQYFGERALITNQPRAATVKAVGELKGAAMDRAAFERLLGPCKELMSRHIESYVSALEVHRRNSESAIKPHVGEQKNEILMPADMEDPNANKGDEAAPMSPSSSLEELPAGAPADSLESNGAS